MIGYTISTSVDDDSGFTYSGSQINTDSSSGFSTASSQGNTQYQDDYFSSEFYYNETYSSSSGYFSQYLTRTASNGTNYVYNTQISSNSSSGETLINGTISSYSSNYTAFSTSYREQNGTVATDSYATSFSTSQSETFSVEGQTTTTSSIEIDYTTTSETSYYYTVPSFTSYSTSTGTNTNTFSQSSSTLVSSSYLDVIATSSSSEGTTLEITSYSYQGSYGTGTGEATVMIPGSDEVLWVITQTGIDILENLAFSTTGPITLTNFSVIAGSVAGDSGGNIISSIYFSSTIYSSSVYSQSTDTLLFYTQDSDYDGFGFSSSVITASWDITETTTQEIANVTETTTLGTGNLPITGNYQSLIYSTCTSIGILNSYAIQNAIYTTFEDTTSYTILYNGTINMAGGTGSISSTQTSFSSYTIFGGYDLGNSGTTYVSHATKKATIALGVSNQIYGTPLPLLKEPNYGFKIVPDQTGVYNEITIGQPWPISLFSSVHLNGDMAPMTYPNEQTWSDTDSVSWTVSWNSGSVFLTSSSGSSTDTGSGSFSVSWSQDGVLSQSFYQEATYSSGYFLGSGTYGDSSNPNYIALPQGFYYRSSGVESVTGTYYSESLSTADFLQTKFGLMVYNGTGGGALFMIDDRATVIGE